MDDSPLLGHSSWNSGMSIDESWRNVHLANVLEAVAGERTKSKCQDDKAGEYGCQNVDLRNCLGHEAMDSMTRGPRTFWVPPMLVRETVLKPRPSWTPADGREFGIVGRTDGTAFRYPTQTETSVWRDIRVISDYAQIVKLLDIRKGLKIFTIESDLTAWFDDFRTSHNIVAYEEANIIYAFMVDVSNPSKPASPDCAGEDGYVHDAHTIRGRDDVCFHSFPLVFFNNSSRKLCYDVTNKANPTIISTTDYAGWVFTRQEWLISDDMRLLLLNDEQDERQRVGPATNQGITTYIFDMSTFANSQNTGFYKSPVTPVDHNQYVDDAIGGVTEFVGAWNSGNILLNRSKEGVFSLKYTG
ncbi:hypothetical protein K469DRAFT_733416 [Zopfia rhizophila CBS 207.26]|uniref:Uncharacterized protein n=1 Tax=Zopfia rhizophila CBS 207.26 TaxID=1314779 RepID=A0A6A6EGB2_9PEZI|nr:hypothetical protein K469DRAFT_733416 [Zopfia rhizophila CBS 207.26]